MPMKIVWEKQFKKAVPFAVYVNGVPRGTIEAGESYLVETPNTDFEMHFVPAPPNFFGWKTLGVNRRPQSDFSELHIKVGIPDDIDRLLEGYQIRCYNVSGAKILHTEYIKKGKNPFDQQ